MQQAPNRPNPNQLNDECKLNLDIATSQLDLAARLKACDLGDFRIGPLMSLPSILEELGADPQTAFAMAGIAPNIFSDANNRAPYELLAGLFKSSVELTKCEHIGLLIGERFDLSGFGPIGALMCNSPTVGDALRSLIQYLHLHDRGATPVLLNLGENCSLLGYSIYRHGAPAIAQIYNAAIAVAYRTLSQLCGADWAALQVQFSHKPPTDISPYRRYFKSRIIFDAEVSGIVFDSTWMKFPIPGADPALHAFLLQAINDVDAKSFHRFQDRVSCVLRQMLLSRTFSGPAIADLFGIHERTLRRYLSKEETSLQKLLSQTRFELAKELIENTALPIADIATVLGYDDANVFSRAFKSWAALSPIQWRKNCLGDAE
jgi:AraC-like DNA-binding protein